MSSARECRLLIDEPAAGPWNMAVDEVLLETAASDGVAALRLYQWSAPTLSLGYFQRYAERSQHAASATLPVVRRLTGGGALVHDRELTYSLALPADHPLARESNALYRTVHADWISTLAALGVEASLQEHSMRSAVAPRKRETGGPPDEPFLCFDRRSSVDVVLTKPGARATTKIIGSAQRRRRGATLQHGGILLGGSLATPELHGIAETTGTDLSAERLADRFAATTQSSLGLTFSGGSFSAGEFDAAQALKVEKYQSANWTARR